MTQDIKTEDAFKLLSIEDRRDRLFFAIGLYAGRRVQEITHIIWRWLMDDRGPRIWVPKQKAFHYFPRSAEFTKIIIDCYEGQDLDSYFMTGRRGCDGKKPMTTSGVNKMIKKYFSMMGVRTLQEASHCIRKTFAVHFVECNRGVESDIDLYLYLQDYFGHRDLKTTLKYICFQQKKLGKLCDNISYSSE